MEAKRFRRIAAFVFLAVLLCLLLFLNLTTGSVRVPPEEIFSAVRGTGEDNPAWNIIRAIRLPRLAAAALLGGALALSGFLLQTFFSNPIAGPFVLGISSGAKLAVALTMIGCLGSGISVSSGMMILAAFFGALLVMGVILLVSGRVRNMSVLVVCGVMVGYICSAVTEFAVTFADDAASADAIVSAVRSGLIAEEQIDESVLRILRWKQSLGLIE